VLALQRTAGNAAVSRAVTDAATLMRAPAAQPSGEADGGEAPNTDQPPELVGLSAEITPGGEGRTGDRADPRGAEVGGEDNSKAFKGDTVRFRARFSGSVRPGGFAVTTAGDGLEEAGEQWIDGQTYEWAVRFTRVGRKRVSISDGGGTTTFTENYVVVADLQDFAAACSEAHALVSARFFAASRRLTKIAEAYEAAFEAQRADLGGIAAAEKAMDDLLWGAFFAGLGGAAGGAAGLFIKRSLSTSDYTVDAGKDLVKFMTRSADKLRGAEPETAGDSTSPATNDPGKPLGDRSASGVSPTKFVSTLADRVFDEGSTVTKMLAVLVSQAREARDANSKADFEDDPVAIIMSSIDLAEIEAIEPDEKAFLKQLWKAWLGAYAWKATPNTVLFSSRASDQVTDDIRSVIVKAAEACDEDADQWIEEFGLTSKIRAQQEADMANGVPIQA